MIRLVRVPTTRRTLIGVCCGLIPAATALIVPLAGAKSSKTPTPSSVDETAAAGNDGTTVDDNVATPVDPAAGGDGTTVDDSGASPVDSAPWVMAIDQLLADEDGVYGVVLMQPDGTVLYRRNGELPFVAASLYKLVLIADICRAVESGALALDTPIYVDPSYWIAENGPDSYFDETYAGLDTTVEEALLATGAYSSNVAAQALLTLTSIDDLNVVIKELGLKGTYLFANPAGLPNWPPRASSDVSITDAQTSEQFVLGYAYDGEVNVTTPNDMAHYFRLLLRGRLLDKFVSKMVTDILSRQVVDNRFPVLLPADTKLIHKTGNLDFVVHDVGVIYGLNGPMILIAMAQAPSNEDRATQVEQRLALIAYGDYDVPPVEVTPLATPVTTDGTSVEDATATPEA